MIWWHARFMKMIKENISVERVLKLITETNKENGDLEDLYFKVLKEAVKDEKDIH